MECIIISVILAYGIFSKSYFFDGWSGWLLLYLIVGIIYLFLMRKINKMLNIKKTLVMRINNFLFHIFMAIWILLSITNAFWMSETPILYVLLILLLIIITLWYQILISRTYFKNTNNVALLGSLYLILPTYFLRNKEVLLMNSDKPVTIKVNKLKLITLSTTYTLILVWLVYYIINLMFFFETNYKPIDIMTNNEVQQ